MSDKKIIVCMDVKDGRVVKGIKFLDLRDIGDPAQCAAEYTRQGADELVFLDIEATVENRGTTVEAVKKAAEATELALTVGGGIRNLDDIKLLLESGAKKVSINSAAIKNPDLIRKASEKYGSQAIVVAVDAKLHEDGKYYIYTRGGKDKSQIELKDWAKKVENLGAGEILLTSIDMDGVKEGYDIDMLNEVCSVVNIPVTASGGCGSLDDFSEVFLKTGASNALAAGVFHDGELTVRQVKEDLKKKGII